MPNLIPVSLSLWAGIYNVLFAFRVGAPVIIMDRFDTQAFAGFVERFQLRSTVLPAGGDDDARRRRVDHLAGAAEVRAQHHRAAVAAAGAPVPRPLRRVRAQRLRPDRDRRRDRRLERADAKEYGDTSSARSAAPTQNVQLRIDADDLGEILVRTPMIEERGTPTATTWTTGSSTAGSAPATSAASTPRASSGSRAGCRDMINRGGLKVFPGEVEEVLRLSPDVADVRGRRHARRPPGRGAVGVRRAAATGATVDADALEALCREHLAPYKVPARFEALDALPRNEVGKVLLRELVARGARA